MTKLNTKLKNFSIRLALLLASSLSYAVVFLGAHTHNTYAATASIAISGNANIVYNHPVPTGTNFFKSLNISVKTDSPTGYNLYLSSDKEETGLVSLDASNPYRIESVSGYNNSIETDMENSYGYNTEKIDNKLYHAIPGLNSPVNIRAVEEEIEEDFNFNLGFRLNDKIPAGQYQRKLVFTMMVLDQARSTIVSGREFNAALKKSLTVTDPSYPLQPLMNTGQNSPSTSVARNVVTKSLKLVPSKSLLQIPILQSISGATVKGRKNGIRFVSGLVLVKLTLTKISLICLPAWAAQVAP